MRAYNNRNVRQLNPMPTMGDRLIAVLSYITAGMVGFIWIILAHVTKKNLKSFVKFHAYQSIFISVCYYLASIIMGILTGFLSVIPFIGKLVLAVVFYLSQMPVVMGYSLLHIAVLFVVIYLVVTALMGRFSEIPWVSDNIKRMM